MSDVNDTDLEEKGNSTNSGTSTSTVDYEKKYKGLSRKFDALQKSYDTLQTQLEEAGVSHESELSQIRRAGQDNSKRVKELEKLLTDEQTKSAQFEKDLIKERKALATREKLSKYETLKGMEEDLRKADEFETDEDYDKYLERMSSRVTQKAVEDKQQKFAGITPPIDTSSRTSGGTRTPQNVLDDIFNLDYTAADYTAKSEALYKEYDAVSRS